MKIVYKQTVYEKLVKEIKYNGSKIDYIELTEDEYHELARHLSNHGEYYQTGLLERTSEFLGKKIVVK